MYQKQFGSAVELNGPFKITNPVDHPNGHLSLFGVSEGGEYLGTIKGASLFLFLLFPVSVFFPVLFLSPSLLFLSFFFPFSFLSFFFSLLYFVFFLLPSHLLFSFTATSHSSSASKSRLRTLIMEICKFYCLLRVS